METYLTIILTILNGLFSISGVLFFYKANRKKADAEAKKADAEAETVEISNLKSMKDYYDSYTNSLRTEINELRERQKELEIKMNGMCDGCKYKKAYKSEKNT